VSNLTGQVALVTGAATGIGRHLVEGLAARGAAVAGLGRTAGRLEAALAEVAAATGAPTLAVAADVTDRAQVEAAVAQVLDEWGRVDLLVNNAGLIDAAETPIWSADPDQWWDVVASHVRGPQLLVHAVLPGMLERGSGRVVNLASGMGIRAFPDYSAYSAAKSALMRITESVAAAAAGTGVTAFDLAPGIVDTAMSRSMPMWEGFTDWVPPERVVSFLEAIAAGELDQWSGRLLSAMVDDLAELRSTTPGDGSRQLRLRPFRDGDAFASR
jgi:NAD(P)-dependent dehydrogenase (short-subunit alcohol dehydrogenase family)